MNVGGLSFTYGLETDDTIGSSYVFNAHDAAWITFARGLFSACQTMYRDRESAGCFNTANFLRKMNIYQATRPERVWVADAQRKYLRPYEDNGTETYLPMLAGRKNHQREQVKTYNAYYYASKYVSNFCTSQNIMVRGNTPTSGTTISVVPPANTAKVSMYINCYIVVASTSYNVVAKTRATRGTTYTMDFSTIGSMGETELYFCTAPMITELGDLAHLYFKQNNFAMGTNLQRLEIGSGLPGYQNTNLESLTIGNNKMLEYLDVRNCPNVTGALDLSGCLSLSEIYLENTSFTGITFATAGLLKKARLSSPTSLTMRELIYLEELKLANTNNLATLRIEDCDFDTNCKLIIGTTTTTHGTKDIILNLVDSSPNMSRVRFSGVDWVLSNESALEHIYEMAGIDDDGFDISQSVVSGDTYIPTMRLSLLNKYNAVWPYLTISYDSIVVQYLATFLNANGEPIIDKNGEAYTQWVDAGSTPYDPVTMGYTIEITGVGTPNENNYTPSEYATKYYRDTSNGYIYYSNGGSWNFVIEAEVLEPSMASTDQYSYTYSGWDGIILPMSANRNVVASYIQTVRTYTVRFYRDRTTLLRAVTDVPYGGCVQYGSADEIIGYGTVIPTTAGYDPAYYNGKYYQNIYNGIMYYSNGVTWTATTYFNDVGIPKWTTDENNNIYRLFKGWDKSTGYITGDMDVTARWVTTEVGLPVIGTDMSDMTTAEIYGICQAGLQEDYFEILDHIDLTLGHDYNFTNVNSLTIGPKYYPDSTEPTLTLGTIPVDQFVSGGYYFDGESYYSTNLRLFEEDSPAFTMALDFDIVGTLPGEAIISANYGDNTNFHVWYDGTNVIAYWGDSSVRIGYPNKRDIVVFRHPKGSMSLYVYTAGFVNGGAVGRYSPDIARSVLTRTTPIVDEPLTLGAVDHHSANNRFRNNAKGHIHWMKIWYDDLGDVNAYNLATWSHEKMRLEYWGKGKYSIDENEGTVSGASFIANSPLSQRGYYINSTSTNVGGWASSMMRSFLNRRILKSMPTDWQAMIQPVRIKSTSGGESTSITTSLDKIYLTSYREFGGTGTGYNDEIGIDAASPSIPWFVAQPNTLNSQATQRIKWYGRFRTYNLENGADSTNISTPCIYRTEGGTEPAAFFTHDIVPGSLWINAYNGYTYMFVTQDELDQYNITPNIVADTTYASGGWVVANLYWTRSPYTVSSTGWCPVVQTGGIGGNYGVTNTYGIVCSLSI